MFYGFHGCESGGSGKVGGRSFSSSVAHWSEQELHLSVLSEIRSGEEGE